MLDSLELHFLKTCNKKYKPLNLFVMKKDNINEIEISLHF